MSLVRERRRPRGVVDRSGLVAGVAGFRAGFALARLKVRRAAIGRLGNLLREEAEMVAVRRAHRSSPDPADDVFCACAEVERISW